MALSPNYNWSEPDNTSLVKDGALAIRTLGNAIDTSLWNSGYGQAGKNKIINGDFRIAQRGTSITIGASGYSLDRYSYAVATAVPTGTISQQTFTPGTAPVSGYEASNFMRVNVTANNGCTVLNIQQPIEDVRTFAGQTAKFSFWAKADATSTINSTLEQNFGSGGSSAVNTAVTLSSSGVLTTGWVRYTATISVPSISGKTIGTNSHIKIILGMPTSAGVLRNGTYDFWGWQLEAGSVATPFQIATGNPASELAACQRYYVRFGAGYVSGKYGFGAFASSTVGYAFVNFPVEMRVKTTAIERGGNNGVYDYSGDIVATNITVDSGSATTKNTTCAITVASGGTQFRPFLFDAVGDTTAYIAFSAEL